jgi:hypothetical protein
MLKEEHLIELQILEANLGHHSLRVEREETLSAKECVE